MDKIAHASRLEAANNSHKKRKKQQAKAKEKWNSLEQSEQEEILKRRNTIDLKQIAKTIIYDINVNKIIASNAVDILSKRIEEINSEIKENPLMESVRKNELETIRGVISVINKK